MVNIYRETCDSVQIDINKNRWQIRGISQRSSVRSGGSHGDGRCLSPTPRLMVAARALFHCVTSLKISISGERSSCFNNDYGVTKFSHLHSWTESTAGEELFEQIFQWWTFTKENRTVRFVSTLLISLFFCISHDELRSPDWKRSQLVKGHQKHLSMRTASILRFSVDLYREHSVKHSKAFFVEIFRNNYFVGTIFSNYSYWRFSICFYCFCDNVKNHHQDLRFMLGVVESFPHNLS